ncbi:MAG: tRNA (adenosine(37)-N6)-threonylcarbamoyltransferase complex ATPase subunit type 1 TsaE [Gammaproteobacteria bacterium]|nr:tRNA (adenosine(37)-N6)-threonylcarbamoyltransferase complex ATPase subunit type 1 TsaE [Gammaproteobacteria bacterium]
MFNVPDESAMLILGAHLSTHLQSGCVLFLHGKLGAGKTTLVRGVLQGLEYKGRVKSPTYTLVESYQMAKTQIYHFDLYRLADPEELEFIGIRDYFGEGAVVLIEWPEKGANFLPGPDLNVTIGYQGQGRRVSISAETDKGKHCLKMLRTTHL